MLSLFRSAKGYWCWRNRTGRISRERLAAAVGTTTLLLVIKGQAASAVQWGEALLG